MKITKLLTALLFFSGILFFSTKAQTAELQIIHNAADPSAAVVDIYVDGNLALDDFTFRTATGFLTLPAGVLINVGVAAGTSTSVSDTLKNFEINLMSGQRYVAIANGVLNPANFDLNPDSRSTGFTLFVTDNVRDMAMMPANVDFIVEHGASDAPTVDVLARNVANLVDDAGYGDITGYISVPPSSYILDVTPGNDNSTIVASYIADLSSLAGGSAVVFASGFLSPATNQNGEGFGLYAALANGTVVAFPSISQARLQVIHNAADPAAAMVDIYINGSLVLNDFEFRTATPLLDLPADSLLNIGVAASTSTSVADTLKNFPVTLSNGQNYVAIANGVLNPANFDSNPDAQSTAFTFFIQDNIRDAAINSSEVDFIVEHGATDAPTVDVVARGVAILVDDAPYGAITNYINVPAASYILDVTPGNDNSVIVASYQADLSGLGGGTAVVFASGFLSPSTNQNGPSFGLFAALASGAVIELPSISQARLQIIHNAADPAASMVDVYVNGALLLDDFEFRTATSYIDVPADVLLNIGVAASTSTSVADTLKNFEVTLMNGQSYIAVANGVLNPAGFAANPDSRSTAFTLFLQDGMREMAMNSGDVDLRVVHGASDAPTVDVLAGGNILVDDAAYSDITPYLSVPPAAYTLDITPGNDNTIIVASFGADLSTLGGGSAVVLASGFLDPSANQNGQAFALMGVLADGTVILFNLTTGIEESQLNQFNIFPNPAYDYVQLNFAESTTLPTTLNVLTSTGQLVSSQEIPQGITKHMISMENLSSGVYYIQTKTAKGSGFQKLMVIN